MGPKPKGKLEQFSPGDVVEYRTPDNVVFRVGIVTSYAGLTHIVQVTDFRSGQWRIVAGEQCKRLHGYLHIDRSERQEF